MATGEVHVKDELNPKGSRMLKGLGLKALGVNSLCMPQGLLIGWPAGKQQMRLAANFLPDARSGLFLAAAIGCCPFY